jgi:hypothetical protein
MYEWNGWSSRARHGTALNCNCKQNRVAMQTAAGENSTIQFEEEPKLPVLVVLLLL